MTEGKPLWKRVWFWILVVGSIGATLLLWPSSRPIVGRWVLQTGAGDEGHGEKTGYEFSKFGRFQRFGTPPNYFGNYRSNGSNLLVLEIKGITAIVNGQRQTLAVGDIFPKEMPQPISLWINEAGDTLETDANPWTGGRSYYRKEY